ncbi:type II toxin-antitoxin system Phd/YefM family antitoxin [Nevskia sp.]|uniref:type II toxin-antitoxin system Phd/YefM family antitoxin n=1 Tax=Nevskia sp. TaxID=1929292 RepID=UPI0025F6CEA6|nr:type II toxin-antitoxin system Phd/YefM family antitoxin [Nevskia sp.]
MKISTAVRPVSYLKANAAQVIRELREGAPPLIVTQNGEATAVVQDIRRYEETEETLALLKLIALGERQVEAGRLRPLSEVVDAIKADPRARA